MRESRVGLPLTLRQFATEQKAPLFDDFVRAGEWHGHGEAKDCGFFRSIINSNLEVRAAAKETAFRRPANLAFSGLCDQIRRPLS